MFVYIILFVDLSKIDKLSPKQLNRKNLFLYFILENVDYLIYIANHTLTILIKFNC